MKQALRILNLEDKPNDTELIQARLEGEGIACDIVRVETERDFVAAIEQDGFDLLLVDYKLPTFDGLSALAIAKEKCPNIPFIFVSGAIGEEIAIEALKSGATDYILKDRLSRLAPAVRRALEDAEEKTARKKAEEFIKNILEIIVEGFIVIDGDYRIITANRAFCKAAKLPLKDIIGEHCYEISHHIPKPCYEAGEDCAVKHVFDTGESHAVIHTHHDAQGKPIYIETKAFPLSKDESGKVMTAIEVLIDITERKRAEEELRDAETRYRLLFDQSPDGIVIIDPVTTRILECNETACRQLGYSREEFARLSIADLEAAEKPEDSRKRVAKVMLEGRNDFETIQRTRQGENRNIHVTAQFTEMFGRPVYHCVWRDITEHRRLEAQYLQAQKMESIGTLAGGVAHDFNNILSAIIGYGHVTLMKMAGDDPQRSNIEHMLEAADRATYLTKSLLLFSRKQITERKPMDLNEVVRKVEKFLGRVIGEDIERKILLCDNPVSILADSHQLEQVLMNLAVNARDAMPGGGAFTVKTEQINLKEDFTRAHGYGKSGVYAMMTISDTGMGMDEATRTHIFEPFFTTKEVGKGTGLGLAVVYGIIRDHDGFINVYSEPGKGATFRIYLPIIGAVVTEETKAQHREAPARGIETVLVAEDDENLRKLSRTVLTEYGYTVIEAVDGEEAVKKFMENKDTIQLLLFDLIMPKMNGKEASDEIRKIKPDMKVLFASGYDPDLIQQKELLEAGVNLVYKPISPMELLRKVRSVLDGVTQ